MRTVFGYGVLGEAVGVERPSLQHTYCDRTWRSRQTFRWWRSKLTRYFTFHTIYFSIFKETRLSTKSGGRVQGQRIFTVIGHGVPYGPLVVEVQVYRILTVVGYGVPYGCLYRGGPIFHNTYSDRTWRSRWTPWWWRSKFTGHFTFHTIYFFIFVDTGLATKSRRNRVSWRTWGVLSTCVHYNICVNTVIYT